MYQTNTLIIVYNVTRAHAHTYTEMQSSILYVYSKPLCNMQLLHNTRILLRMDPLLGRILEANNGTAAVAVQRRA
jgi:hypothetical protein